MSEKKIKNTRNTDNPYELISGAKLFFKDDPSISVSIYATKFDCKRVKKHNHLIMTEFDVIEARKPKKKSEKQVIELFKRVVKFSKLCKNPVEVITIFFDAWEENKKLIDIDISTCPVYPDNADKNFVLRTLI